MKLLTRLTLALLLLLLSLLTACRQAEEQRQQISEYYEQISDTIQKTSLSQPEANIPFIDSLEQAGSIPTVVADYFRTNSFYALEQLRAVEFYSKKALDNGLYEVWPKAFYICSRNLANNLRWKGNQESALHYATSAYQRALDDPSPDAKLNAPGLLMFIALCQYDLGYMEESRRNLERSYEMSLEVALADSSFNPRYHLAMNGLSTLMSMKPNVPKEEIDKWIERAKLATSMLTPACDLDERLSEQATSIMTISIARIRSQRGETAAADSAYQEFLKSDYAKTGSGIVSKYRYLQTAQRWAEAAALIPQVDSVRYSRDQLLTLETLKNKQEEYLIFMHAGMKEQAQQRVDLLIESIDTIIRHQQLSTANEMSSIFETQQQERKIAEQKTVLARQRTFAVTIIMLLIFIFALFFSIYMRKETKKVEHEHQELQKAYEQLTVANEKAEESSRMKSTFIKHISHEIRTPLNIVSGFSQVITAADYNFLDEQTRKEASVKIVENTERITELVNKMLELSEASSTAKVERTMKMNAGIIVRKAVEESLIDCSPDIAFSVSYVSPATSRLTLLTQERQAVRALSLILDNARKFTKKGDVRLIVSREANEAMIAFTPWRTQASASPPMRPSTSSRSSCSWTTSCRGQASASPWPAPSPAAWGAT